MKKLLPYKAVLCPFCGRIQITKGEKSFRCRLCGKTSSFRHDSKWNVKLKDFHEEKQAREYCKEWKRSKAGETDGFKSGKDI